MPPRAGPPLRKIIFNAYEADCKWFERRYGRGWSEKIRDLMSKHRTIVEQAKDMADTLGFKEVPND